MLWFNKKLKLNLKKKRQIWGLTLVFLVLIIVLSFVLKPDYFIFKTESVLGSDADNLSGFAKILDDGEESSWISLNCISDPFLGGQNIFTFTLPLRFSFPTCDEDAYGVNIESDGSFTGYALSDKYGYIDFAPVGSPQMPSYSSSTGLVTGYAKILDLGENGWLRLHEEVGQPYDPVSVDDYTGDFYGYAYNDTIGWVSFNCEDESVCGVEEYNVNYYRPLLAGDLSAPNWSIAQACETGIVNKAVLRWDFTGDPQTAYQIVIDDDPIIDDDAVVFDSGKIISESTQFLCPGSENCKLEIEIEPYTRNYNVRFYWWIKLWDTHDAETEWTQFNTNLGHTLTDNIDGNSESNPNANLTFTTFKHPMPSPYFTWNPTEIYAGDDISFDSAGSAYYQYEGEHHYLTEEPHLCGTEENDCQYLWSVDGEANISDPTNSTTTISFLSFNATDRVHLQITDVDGYICSTSSDLLDINLDLPIWRESFGY